MIRTISALVLLAVSLIACSSSPYAPANQSGPIRSMDSFFSGGRTDYSTPSPDDRYQRGYPTGPYRSY